MQVFALRGVNCRVGREIAELAAVIWKAQGRKGPSGRSEDVGYSFPFVPESGISFTRIAIPRFAVIIRGK
jgi:hypothetical protein